MWHARTRQDHRKMVCRWRWFCPVVPLHAPWLVFYAALYCKIVEAYEFCRVFISSNRFVCNQCSAEIYWGGFASSDFSSGLAGLFSAGPLFDEVGWEREPESSMVGNHGGNRRRDLQYRVQVYRFFG